jgi:phosphatidylglycerophosphate synthase
MRLNWAHTLTLSRLALTPTFVFLLERAVAASAAGWAHAGTALVFALVCGSDYFDGPLARRQGRQSVGGRLFDNLADLCFLLVSLGYLVRRGALPWAIPLAVTAAFSQYALDSYVLSRRRRTQALFGNTVGHWAGILNYSFVGLFSAQLLTHGRLLPPTLDDAVVLFWLGYLLLAMCTRMRFFLKSYRSPWAPAPPAGAGICSTPGLGPRPKRSS